MKIHPNPNWLSADVQARIEPPSFPLIKAELEEEKLSDIIKIKIHREPASSTSETYKLKISTFEKGKPE